MHESIFESDIPILAFTEVPKDKHIMLLQKAIYADLNH